MLTEIDLDAAAAKGIISEDQAISLRNFEAERAQESLSMAEKFQIFGGLSDIMAAAGLAMVLIAFAQIFSGNGLSIIFIIFPPVLLLIYKNISPRGFVAKLRGEGFLERIERCRGQRCPSQPHRNIARRTGARITRR